MEKDSQKNVVNHFEAGSNCQVFNGNITGCVFAISGKPRLPEKSGEPCVSAALQTIEAEELMARLLGFTQQETVVVLIEFPHFLLDTAQQSQLVQMAQGEVCRLIELPLTGTLFYRIAQDIA